MDVENFFNLYSDQEIVKQTRELEQIANGKVPKDILGKKAEIPKFNNLKKKNPQQNNRYANQQISPSRVGGINSASIDDNSNRMNTDENEEIGEYEIDLGLDEEVTGPANQIE